MYQYTFRKVFIVKLLAVNYTVSKKNDNDVAHYNFNAHKPILVIFAQMLLSEYIIKWFVIPPPIPTSLFVSKLTIY